MNLIDLPQHAAVHVVSDLHMGGPAGSQILRETQRLAGFIQRVTAERPGKDVALVLAGDVFDTLAEDHGDGYLAMGRAQQVVGRIIDDDAFKPIWDALAGFARRPRRTLVFLIGNHDLEIAFPAVQALIRNRLAGGDEAARGRIAFVTTGAGYACLVGPARVYCTHGNEVDDWNLNRYEELARVGRRLQADEDFEPGLWKPNAGTRMVKDVMNRVKRRYAWIDLLKPENEAAVGTLLAIDPGQLKKLSELVPIMAEKKRGGAELEGRLSITATAQEDAEPRPIESCLGPNLRALRPAQKQADEMLRLAEAHLAAPDGTVDEGTLGLGLPKLEVLNKWIRGLDKAEALRLSLLDWLAGDKSFDRADQDATCVGVMKHVGPAVDIVVTGHTHLARALALDGGRLYFNSGTWIRLMRFTEAMLKDSTSFAPVYAGLVDGQMSTLDAQGLILDFTTEVEIVAEESGAVGRLNQITGDGSAAPTALCTLRRSL